MGLRHPSSNIRRHLLPPTHRAHDNHHALRLRLRHEGLLHLGGWIAGRLRARLRRAALVVQSPPEGVGVVFE